MAAIAVPAAANSTFKPTKETLCLASGATTYRLAHNAPSPDVHIKIADDAAQPDLRIQLVESAEIADFVLVDDFSSKEQAPCQSSTPIRTVTLDAEAPKPNVAVNLSADAAASDHKIYVHSARFSRQNAAALPAPVCKTNQRHEATGAVR